MASSIDATKPVQGNPTTLSVRDNFSAAKSEIEALQGITVTAGTGLTGGGTLTASFTINTGAGTGITVNADDVALDTAHARNVDHSAVSVTAGNGLTGGGTLEATRNLAVGAGTGITVNADDVALDATSPLNDDHSAISVTAGAGLTGGGTIEVTRTVNVGAGTGITVNADDVALNLTYTDDRYLPKNSETNVVTGTTDTLAAADEGTDIVYTAATAVTVTIPGTLDVGFQCTITQAGAGTVTLTSADNLNGGSADIAINAQWSAVTLLQYSEGNWAVVGDAS